MPTIAQIRAARALLDWSQSDLAEHAGLSQTGIARIENGTNKPNSQTLEKIHAAFDRNDVEFIDESGVKKREGEVRKLEGRSGFLEFMDDVYSTLKDGGDMSVFNVDEKHWIKWMGDDAYNNHAKRMAALGEKICARIVVREGDDFFIANDFSEYRWFPEEFFSDQTYYAYGDKLALINFASDSVKVLLLNQSEFTKGFRVLFDIAWNSVAKQPE